MARPTLSHVHRRVDHAGGEFLLRLFMALEAKPGRIVLQFELIAESVTVMALLTLPLAESRMRDRLRLLRVVPLVVTLDAGLPPQSRPYQEDPGQQQAGPDGALSCFDRCTSPVHLLLPTTG